MLGRGLRQIFWAFPAKAAIFQQGHHALMIKKAGHVVIAPKYRLLQAPGAFIKRVGVLNKRIIGGGLFEYMHSDVLKARSA